MDRVNVAVECNIVHKASVYALVTSIKVNKNSNSRYCIYMLTGDTASNEWEELLSLKNEDMEIYIHEGNIDTLSGMDKVIYLQWNTLVMGDLSQLYNVDLEGRAFAAAENLPEKAYDIPADAGKYNSAVRLIDLKSDTPVGEYKELSVFYNYGYEDFVKNKRKISHKKLEITEKEYDRLKEWALVLRIDKDNAADEYFDGPLSELWMKYYRMSPMGNIPLRRKAYVETIGNVTVDSEKAVPILMRAEDESTAYVIAQITALIENADKERQLDIRIVYKQLSQTHKDMLSGLNANADNVSIVLYNIQEYYQKGSYELLTALIFTEYEKALCIKKGMICQGDIAVLYDTDIKGYLLAAYEAAVVNGADSNEIKNLSKDIYFRNLPYLDNDVMLVNVKEWNNNGICGKVEEMRNNRAYSKYSSADIINMVCQKKIKEVHEELEWCKGSRDKDKYSELVDAYIEKTPWSEKLKEEIVFYKTREDESVKKVLDRLKKLEETNAKLRERNRELTAENANLTEEKDQYLYEILETRKSVTYKIGRAITFIPRKLRGNK